MTDKEKLDLLEHYVMTLLSGRIDLQLSKGKFGLPLNRFNKVECAYLEGEIDTLNKIRYFIEKMNEERKETE